MVTHTHTHTHTHKILTQHEVFDFLFKALVGVAIDAATGNALVGERKRVGGANSTVPIIIMIVVVVVLTLPGTLVACGVQKVTIVVPRGIVVVVMIVLVTRGSSGSTVVQERQDVTLCETSRVVKVGTCRVAMLLVLLVVGLCRQIGPYLIHVGQPQ